MLAIEVSFLTGRYVATAYNSRRESEWPPHPARLFSALVATHAANDRAGSAEHQRERAVLEWLEALDAPGIAASEASEREVVTVFVPVNDASVLPDFDGAQTRLDACHAALEGTLAALAATDVPAAQCKQLEKDRKSQTRDLEKATTKLREAFAKETAAPASISKQGPRDAMAVLPEHRTRQPRTFPSMTPSDPRVTFVWEAATPTRDQVATLDRLLARLVRVGHSSSLVTARVVDPPPRAQLVPGETGRPLRVVRAGQLAALENAFALHQETEPRVMPARFQLYETRRAPQTEPCPTSIFSPDWLVLRRVGGPVLPSTSAAGVARTIRKALMRYCEAPIPMMLSGHQPDGARTAGDHLAIVPLPFVGSQHADGSLLGVALVLPENATEADRRAIFRAVAAWEHEARNDDEDAPALPIHLGPASVWEVERIEGLAPRSNLRAETWCRPATTWLSATPVALDRHPGNLHERDPKRLAKALREAEETVRRACVRIGLPEPTHVEILPAAPLVGASKAKHFPTFAQGGDQGVERVRTHVRLEFEVAVRGPILLGAGRYHGLGLFRPESRDV